MIATEQIAEAKSEKKSIKCVVWDLDNTIWDGVLLEDDKVTLRDGIKATLQTFDERGILQSIASRNEAAVAIAKLKEFGIYDYFLYPEINWNSKSGSLRTIAEAFNIGLDTFAFIDDQPFEREEVAYELPEVLCIDAADVDQIAEMPRMNPRFITSESKLRRQMYVSDAVRNRASEEFTGSNEAFLATLDMVFHIKPAGEEDLQRAEELTMRTNQLNTTGYTYSYEELRGFCDSDEHLLLVASLEDRFGIYGTIGLALIEQRTEIWTLKLLLMSCRVMSRGVGTIMMNYIMSQTKRAGARLQAEFLPNGRNRMMYVTYKFGGFKEIHKAGELAILEHNLAQVPSFPDYVQVHIDESAN